MKDQDGSAALALLAILVIGLALLIFVSLAAAIVWWIGAALAREARRRWLRRESGERYDQAVFQNGLTIEPDDGLQIAVAGGLEFPKTGGNDALDMAAGVSVGLGFAR